MTTNAADESRLTRVGISSEASAEEISGFWQAVSAVTRQLGLESTGYRLIANTGPDSAQTVPHFHVHILAGHPFSHVVVVAK
jgi:histidine triad (HIT) family protein